MGKFFLAGTPLYKKILAFIILAPFAAGLAVLFIDFLPSADVDNWSTMISARLLASSLLADAKLWAADKRLKKAAKDQGSDLIS